jgi:hypothetical protein
MLELLIALGLVVLGALVLARAYLRSHGPRRVTASDDVG